VTPSDTRTAALRARLRAAGVAEDRLERTVSELTAKLEALEQVPDERLERVPPATVFSPTEATQR
jgi:hypothetical protein